MFAALVTKSMEAGSSCVIYSCKKKNCGQQCKNSSLKTCFNYEKYCNFMDFKKGQKARKNSKRTGRYLLENYKLSVGRFFAISSEP